MSDTPQGISIRANMMWNSVGSMIRLGCNYLVTIAVVRLAHGFDAAGALALAMAISNLVLPFAEFRLRTIHVTDVDREHSAGGYIALRIITTFLACAVGLIYALATTHTRALPVVALYLLYSLITNFIEGLHAVDQRHWRMDYIGRSYILQGVGTLIVFCASLALTNSLEIAVGFMAIAVTAVAIFYDFPRARRFENLRPSVSWRPAIKTLITLLPLVFAQVSSSAVLTIPRQHLSAAYGSSALGIYASVAAPAVIVQMGATYVYSPLMGRFAESFATKKQEAKRLLLRTIIGITCVGIVCSLLLLLAGKYLLWLMYGHDIVEYTYLLQPALLCTFVTAFAWFMNDLLLTLRDYTASFMGNAMAAVVTALSSTFFVDKFGMNGVSWVGVVAYSCAVISLFTFFLRDYRRLDNE